ncbi:MAG: FkbM family methyltransferase [Planctomycetota bacterium]|jgi:FkbM family methyltransferase
MKKSTNEKAREVFQGMFQRDPYDAFVLEAFALMSILEEIGPEPVTFFELGSGRAPWCMAVAGAVRFGFVLDPPRSYRLLAVEAEPTHYEWTTEHLSKQSIPAQVVHGAVTDRVGRCRFRADTDPADHMGQSVGADGNLEVPSFTIDYLRETYGFERIHIIHMDIQGMEIAALRGARESLGEDRIDYLIIGTHGEHDERELRRVTAATHDLVVELPVGRSLALPGISKPFRSSGDGVQVYRRRGLGRGPNS